MRLAVPSLCESRLGGACISVGASISAAGCGLNWRQKAEHQLITICASMSIAAGDGKRTETAVKST